MLAKASGAKYTHLEEEKILQYLNVIIAEQNLQGQNQT